MLTPHPKSDSWILVHPRPENKTSGCIALFDTVLAVLFPVRHNMCIHRPAPDWQTDLSVIVHMQMVSSAGDPQADTLRSFYSQRL